MEANNLTDNQLLDTNQLLDLCKSALACMKAGDNAGAENLIKSVPRAQLPYVAASLKGAAADKRANTTKR